MKIRALPASPVFSLEFASLPCWASQVALVVKSLPANAGDIRDVDSIPGLGRSIPWRRARQPSILARRITWTEEPGRLQPMGLQRVDTTEVTSHTHHRKAPGGCESGPAPTGGAAAWHPARALYAQLAPFPTPTLAVEPDSLGPQT